MLGQYPCVPVLPWGLLPGRILAVPVPLRHMLLGGMLFGPHSGRAQTARALKALTRVGRGVVGHMLLGLAPGRPPCVPRSPVLE